MSIQEKCSALDWSAVGREAGQWVLTVAVVGIVMFAMSSTAHATSTGMPWEGTLTKILDSLQGPIAQFIGVLAIVITGGAFALGEGGQMFKRGMGVAFGLSVAFAATSIVSQFGWSGSALI